MRRQNAIRSRTRPLSPASPATNSWARSGQRLKRARAARGLVDGDVAPAEDGQPLIGGEAGDLGEGTIPFGGIGWQEGQADGVAARLGQREPGDRAEERVGNLGEDAGAVAGVRVRARGAAVLKVAKDAEGAGHHIVTAPGPQVRDKADAAGVMFETAVV